MLMKPHAGKSKATGSLAVQIDHAQRKLIARKQRISVHGARLGHHLQASLTRPTTLFFAGGCGFVLAEFANRPIKTMVHQDGQPITSDQVTQDGSFLSSINFGTLLNMVLPLIYPAKE